MIGGQLPRAVAHLLAFGAEEGFQRFRRADRLRFGMVEGAEIAQRLEKLRRQNQHQKTGKQRYAEAVAAEIEFAEVRKAKVHRHHGDGNRSEEFQHAGREEGHAQHFHGAAAEVFGGFGDLRGFGLRAVEQPQGVQAAQAVEEVAAQSRQRHEVAAVGVGGPHTDQRHEQRDQRRGRQQNQTGGPIDREDGDQDQQRDEDRQIHLRQIARVIVLHILDLLDDDAGPTARRFALDPGRAELLQLIQHLLAHALTDHLATQETDPLSQPAQQRPQCERGGQPDKRREQLLAWGMFDDQGVQQAGQQPRLRHDQQAAEQPQQHGKAQPMLRQRTLGFKPTG